MGKLVSSPMTNTKKCSRSLDWNASCITTADGKNSKEFSASTLREMTTTQTKAYALAKVASSANMYLQLRSIGQQGKRKQDEYLKPKEEESQFLLRKTTPRIFTQTKKIGILDLIGDQIRSKPMS